MMTAFSCIIFLKKLDNNFKLHLIFQYIAKFRSKCAKTKMALYPELKDGAEVTTLTLA